MHWTYIVNDLRKNRAITAVITLFILLAALLTATAGGMFAQLIGSIDRMMAAQKVPHLLQMHAGPVDNNRIAAFANSQPDVEDWLVQDFLNFDGAQIRIEGESLENSTQDNGLVTQNPGFDWLVDENGTIIHPRQGEIWLPLLYSQDGTAKVGDTVRIGPEQWAVAGFLRDAQMNSPLAGSKRWLIAEEDFQKVLPHGTVESLIEFRLKDDADVAALEAAYQQHDLPGNGPTVTYALFRIMNALTDGIVIAVFMLASVLVILVAFLCIRLTLLAQIEEDYREIGVMKAIGMRLSDIRSMYLSKYGAIAGVAALAGFLLSQALTPWFTQSIRLNMGPPGNATAPAAIGFLGSILIFLVVVLYVRRVLGLFKKITASEAVRFGAPREHRSVRGPSLQRTGLPVNAFLGIKDVLIRAPLFVTMALVLILSAFLLVLPQNLYNTISSRQFITYNGIGDTDLMIHIRQSEDMETEIAAIASDLQTNPYAEAFTVIESRLFEVEGESRNTRIKVDTGDHTVFPIQYTQGRAPETDGEMALSSLQADDLAKQVGDAMTLRVDGASRSFRIVGIYSDITNGGKTAKARFNAHGPLLAATVYVQLREGADRAAQVDAFAAEYPNARVAEIGAYFARMMGALVSALRTAMFASVFVSAFLVFLITVLFVRLLLAKDRHALAVLKVSGFTNSDLRRQFLARMLTVAIVSIPLGILLANTAGESIGTALIRSFGVTHLRFVIRPLLVYGLAPILMLAVVWLATRLGTAGLVRADLSETLKE